jgi:hypothetical protein
MRPRSALSRRAFIGAAIGAGGAALFYASVGTDQATAASRLETPPSVDSLLGGWIRIAPDGGGTDVGGA